MVLVWTSLDDDSEATVGTCLSCGLDVLIPVEPYVITATMCLLSLTAVQSSDVTETL